MQFININYFVFLLKNSKIGLYFLNLYARPHSSELFMGKFLFFRTAILIAFSYSFLGVIPFFVIILFTSMYDFFIGRYQHTVANFCNRTYFKNIILQTVENLFRRILLDSVRAEGINFIALGLISMSLHGQSHIFVNRLGSSSYYFNAVLMDRLVDGGVLGRDFRARFIIFASSFGGLLSTMHLADTRMPAFMHGCSPLQMLLIFNLLVFCALGFVYFKSYIKKQIALWLQIIQINP
jgi:hypothetical protein